MTHTVESLDELKNILSSARIKALKDPESTFDIAKNARECASENGWFDAEALALFVMALCCRTLSKLDQCHEYATNAYDIYVTLEDNLGIATTLNIIGVVYFYYGKLETALSYFLKALHFLERADDPITESRILNNIGEVYKESDNFDEALKVYHKALALCEAHDMKVNIAVVLENIGEIYYRKKEYSISYDYILRSYDMLLALEDTTALSEVENRLGKILFLQGKREEGKLRCINALKRLDEVGNTFYAIDVLMTLAEIKKDEGSLDYVDDLAQAVTYAETLNARKPLRKLYQLFYEHYEQEGFYDLALFYFKKYHHIELEIESTVMSHKLEIIKIELNKTYEGDALEKLKNLNKQLEVELENQARQLAQLEQANKQLDEAVYIDELTGVLNRRGINDKLLALWNKATSDQSEIALLMIDIDHFKQFNDTYGHVQGDRCLHQISEAMLSAIQFPNAILGWYGGEEFMCVLFNVNLQQAEHQAELLRRAVYDKPIAVEHQNLKVSVTISVGGIHGKMYEFNALKDLYIKADKALYCAKDCGRNQVCFNSNY